VLPHASFSKDRAKPSGLKSCCRACSSQRHKEWRKAHAN
jgi:hypothetical protein